MVREVPAFVCPNLQQGLQGAVGCSPVCAFKLRSYSVQEHYACDLMAARLPHAFAS
jgi:hypothetical protein